ncbi:MAG: DUF4998 domain-containing protein, partial [Treponema sp.]|nr:DUF4998 domain-containing protein [Treponema sp.]
MDTTGNRSTGIPITATPVAPDPGDIAPPANVTVLVGTPGNGSVMLSWTDPIDADFARVEITHNQTGGTAPVTVIKGVKTYTWSNLTNGTAYTFTLKTVDRNGNRSTGVSIPATPTNTMPPARVTGLTATPDSGQITLSRIDPAAAGLDYIEITWGGGSCVTVPKSDAVDQANSKTIAGLTNGTTYTFTVTAVDTAEN